MRQTEDPLFFTSSREWILRAEGCTPCRTSNESYCKDVDDTHIPRMLKFAHSVAFMLIILTIQVCEPSSGQYDLEKGDTLADMGTTSSDKSQASKAHKKLVALVPVRSRKYALSFLVPDLTQEDSLLSCLLWYCHLFLLLPGRCPVSWWECRPFLVKCLGGEEPTKMCTTVYTPFFATRYATKRTSYRHACELWRPLWTPPLFWTIVRQMEAHRSLPCWRQSAR
jgi:hypothetical protein